MYTALLFDLDGTLVDSVADIAASVNHVRAQFDLAPLPLESVRAAVGDGLPKLLERTVPVEGHDLRALYLAHHQQHLLDHATVYPGIAETLAQLSGRAGMAVVSNKPQQLCLQLLQGLGLAGYFHVVVGGDTPAGRKPSAGPLEFALQQLGIGPWNALMIGDSAGDLRAGRAAGTATCAVTWGYRDAATLRAEQPDHVIEQPAELEPLLAHQQGRIRNVFELVGAETIQRLARAFYARVDRDPRIRAMFPRELGGPVERQALFVAQFFGGPSEYSRRRGHPRLRMRHAPFAIDAAAAAAWYEHMDAAITEVGIAPEPAAVMRRYFAHTARFLINRE